LTWGWTFNSLGQNACTIAAYLMASCYGGAFSIASLAPGGQYVGPTATDVGSQCKCTTVAYSLISACDACQGANWVDWSNFTIHCSVVEPPSSFPYPVPSGTRVPAWALLDITSYPNKTWDSSKAFAVGDTPELAPGAAISSSSSTSSGTTSSRTVPNPSATSENPSSPLSSSSSSPSPSPASHSSSSNVGAIAGGAAGGVAAIAIAGFAVFFYRSRRSPKGPSYTTAASNSPQQQPFMGKLGQSMLDDGAISPSPSTPVTSMRLYDPNDPTTFPGYQPPEMLIPPGPVPFSPYTGGGGGGGGGAENTLANMQTAHGYHGLPTV